MIAFASIVTERRVHPWQYVLGVLQIRTFPFIYFLPLGWYFDLSLTITAHSLSVFFPVSSIALYQIIIIIPQFLLGSEKLYATLTCNTFHVILISFHCSLWAILHCHMAVLINYNTYVVKVTSKMWFMILTQSDPVSFTKQFPNQRNTFHLLLVSVYLIFQYFQCFI